MPCRQSSTYNGKAGSGQSGGGGYITEADCLQACKEGACCDGTTCTVKPQCQCRCASNSCCGPDTMTVDGITGPRCRGGTKSECDARGGTWRPCIGCSADASTPNASICLSTDRPSPSQPVEPVFKGVGTTCTPYPCLYGCGDCNSIPASLTATITSSGGNYLSDMACVAGNSSLTLSRPNVLQAAAPAGCWNSSAGSGCDITERSDYWTSGIGAGGLMFRVIGQCVQGTGARIMSQMYATCSGSQIVFGFSCGKTRATASGCPDAYDAIGAAFPFTTVFDFVQLGLTVTSCSPFLATGTRVVNGVTLTVTLSGNPLP